MTRTVLPNGNIKLTAEKGILDLRNFHVSSVVICKPINEKWYVEAE